MNREIAERLIALRRDKGLSQEGLAARLGVSRQAVSKWERAESAPDLENLVALADLYAVTVDELVRGPGAAEVADVAAGEVALAGNAVADALAGAAAGEASGAGMAVASGAGTPTSETDVAAGGEVGAGAALGDSDAEPAVGGDVQISAEEGRPEMVGPEGSELEGARLEGAAPAEASTAGAGRGGTTPEEATPEGAAAKKRSRWKTAALAAAGALVFFGVMSAMVYALVLSPDTNVPFAKEMADYEPSAYMATAELVDKNCSEQGEGNYTAQGFITALFLDWPEGNATVRVVSDSETNGALVVRDLSSSAAMPVKWHQQGGCLVVYQEDSDDSAESQVEILVPTFMSSMDLLQMRVGGGSVIVEGPWAIRAKVQQSGGLLKMSDAAFQQAAFDVLAGELNYQGGIAQAAALTQQGGSSWLLLNKTAPSTMDIVMQGGAAEVGIGADEGCRVSLKDGGGSFEFAFPGAVESGGTYSVGSGQTAIQADVSGGSLTVCDRYRMVTEGGGQPTVASEN